MVVDHRGKQIICRTDGVEVAGEVQIDVLHRDYLSISTACGAALDTEHGAERRLTQGDNGLLTDLAQTVGETYCRGGLAFTGGSGVDGSDEYELSVRMICHVAQQGIVDLGLVIAVLLEVLFVDTGSGGDFCDLLLFAALCDLNVGLEFHKCFLSS